MLTEATQQAQVILFSFSLSCSYVTDLNRPSVKGGRVKKYAWVAHCNTDWTKQLKSAKQTIFSHHSKREHHHWWLVTFGFSSCKLWNVLQFKVTCCWSVVVGNGLAGRSVIFLLLEWWCQCPWWTTHQRRMLAIAEDNLWTTIEQKCARKLEVNLIWVIFCSLKYTPFCYFWEGKPTNNTVNFI